MTVELPARRTLRTWQAVLAALVALAAAGGLHSHLRTQRVADRLDVGCFDVDDCRALVHLAEGTADACWFGCASHADLVARARARFRAALESAAHEERQLQDQDYERGLETRRQAETARLEREHERRLAELDRQHRHELAVLAAETERLREQRAQVQLQRVAYLKQLSRPQRWARLAACHAGGQTCDDLMLALTQAAGSETERADLIDTHERHVTSATSRTTRPVLPVAAARTSPAAFDANSNPSEPAPL